jgi:UrcA family protein
MNKSLLIVLAAAAFPVAASAGTPQLETEAVSVGVGYEDLALDKRAGAETLARRVQAAIDSVCARPNDMRSLKVSRDWQRCREAAQTQAKEQITPVLAVGEVAVASRY